MLLPLLPDQIDRMGIARNVRLRPGHPEKLLRLIHRIVLMSPVLARRLVTDSAHRPTGGQAT
jgi:hypothetical protein